MAGNPIRQVLDSFEDIGKDVVQEVAKVPADVAGKALESLGTKSGNSGKQSASRSSEKSVSELLGLGGGSKTKTPLDEMGEAKDVNIKRAMARKALEYLAKRPNGEPSIWEKIQKEEKEKKDASDSQKALARKSELPVITGKRKAGDLFGVHAKKTATENRSVRQD